MRKIRKGVRRLLLLLLAIGPGPVAAESVPTAMRESAAALIAVLQEESPLEGGFDLTACVTYVSTNRLDGKTNVAVRDSTGDVLFRAEDRRGFATMPQPGDRARCRGVFERNVYGRRFAVLTNYVRCARGERPAPEEFTRAELFDGRHDYRLCRFSGTLRDATVNETDPYWILLSICSGEGRVFATVPIDGEGDLERMERHVGARISVTGICVPYDHSPRIQAGRLFKIAAMREIAFPDALADDIDKLPSVESIRLSQPSDVATLGRHRAAGWVVAAWKPDHALLKTETGDYVTLVFGSSAPLPAYGARIAAEGLPDSDLFRITLFDALWTPLPGAAFEEEEPRDVSARTMLRDRSGRPRVDCAQNGHVVRLRGLVRSLSDEGESARFYVESDGCLVPVDASAAPEARAALEVGSLVSVAGTCVLEVASPRLNSAIPRLRGFSLVPRRPADIVLLARPSWWTARRLFMLLGAFAILLVGILAWNASLRHLVERRGRELAEASIARVTSELRVVERTRLAVELHDSIAQNLTGVSLEIDTARRLVPAAGGAIESHLDTASAALKSCRTELRNCLWDLRHQALESADMEEAIRQTLAPHLGATRLALRFRVPRERLSDSTAHAILRIVRELTVNAIRHGGATVVHVAGSIENAMLLFSVRDNGCGFDPAHCPGDAEGHYGLLGIRERINTFEGELKIESAPGKGARVAVALHIPQTRKGETCA